VAGDPPELVGWGGFKGPPGVDGVVEVGYAIAPAREGRGLATAAARALVDEAFADERVVAVVAHTLAEANASNRVLEKAGFAHDGEATDGDRPVWRFRRER
jgi:RimJ/RimL family protein N-acetyltransferase